jgi:hypothetical protein
MQILGIIGTTIYLIGWFWLIFTSFKTSGIVWAIINFFLQPFTGLIFCLIKKEGWKQFILMIVGLVIMIVGFLPNIQKTIEQLSAR